MSVLVPLLDRVIVAASELRAVAGSPLNLCRQRSLWTDASELNRDDSPNDADRSLPSQPLPMEMGSRRNGRRLPAERTATSCRRVTSYGGDWGSAAGSTARLTAMKCSKCGQLADSRTLTRRARVIISAATLLKRVHHVQPLDLRHIHVQATKQFGMKFRVDWYWNNVAGDPYYALAAARTTFPDATRRRTGRSCHQSSSSACEKAWTTTGDSRRSPDSRPRTQATPLPNSREN
jgi:hypothetical protein